MKGNNAEAKATEKKNEAHLPAGRPEQAAQICEASEDIDEIYDDGKPPEGFCDFVANAPIATREELLAIASERAALRKEIWRSPVERFLLSKISFPLQLSRWVRLDLVSKQQLATLGADRAPDFEGEYVWTLIDDHLENCFAPLTSEMTVAILTEKLKEVKLSVGGDVAWQAASHAVEGHEMAVFQRIKKPDFSD